MVLSDTLPKEKRSYYTSINVTALALCEEEDSLQHSPRHLQVSP